MAISKFNQVFNKDNETYKASAAVIKKLNKQAPKGYTYDSLKGKDHVYALRGPKDEIQTKVKVKSPKFPLKFKGMSIDNMEELFDAMYRTQQSYTFTTCQPGLGKMVLDYTKPQDKPQDFEIKPAKFEPVSPIECKIGKKMEKIPIERVPFPSLTKAKFVSNHKLIKLVIVLDEKSKKFDLNFGFSFDNLEKLDDYFKNIELIRRFFDKGGKMLENDIKPSENQKEAFKTNHKFLEELKQLQDHFRVKFDFPHNMTDEDKYNIDLLKSAMGEVPMKNKNEEISFVTDDSNVSVLEGKLNSEIEISHKKPIKLFGEDLKLCVSYPNLRLRELKKESGRAKLICEVLDDSYYYVSMC